MSSIHVETDRRGMKPIDCCATRCFLCDEVNGQAPLSYFLGHYENPTDKVIEESFHFVAFPDISPIVPGHTLLLPKSHVLSLAQIPTDHWPEFNQIKRSMMDWVNKRFGNVFVFEHGSMADDIESGVCIQHAHLHIIPAQVEITNKLQAYSQRPIEYRPIDIQKALSEIKTSYLYYEDSNGLGCLIHPYKPVPQQLICMLVAQSCHMLDWDWKAIALPYLL